MHRTVLSSGSDGGFKSLWWKAERYELRGGCIAPVKGASMQPYDPWALVEEKRKAESGPRPLCLSAVDLCSKLKRRRDPLPRWPHVLERESEQLLIDWCNDYGLLGLLPHEVEYFSPYPRFERSEGSDQGWPVSLTFRRSGVDWQCERTRWKGREHIAGFKESEDYGIPDPKDWPSRVQPGYLKRSIEPLLLDSWMEGTVPELSKLDRSWFQYFPDLDWPASAAYPFPCPYTPEFWAIYGEPIQFVYKAIRLLARCAEAMAEPKSGETVAENQSDVREHARRVLNVLAEPVSIRLNPNEDGQLVQQWESPSLLGELAVMLIFEVSRSRILKCEGCDSTFAADAYQRLYCSDTCRSRVQKRRQRAKAQLLERRKSGR